MLIKASRAIWKNNFKIKKGRFLPFSTDIHSNYNLYFKKNQAFYRIYKYIFPSYSWSFSHIGIKYNEGHSLAKGKYTRKESEK